MRRRALPVLAAGLLLAGAPGCGEEGPAYELTTPPVQAGAVPLPPDAGAPLVDRDVTAARAQRVRPVIERWSRAIAAGDIDAAARFFDLPTIVGQPGQPPIELRTPAVARAFNVSLSCAPKLISLKPDGRYVVGAFVQDELDGRVCEQDGDVSRIGFVFGDPDHPRQFTEWWETEPGDDGSARPDMRPKDAVPVAPLQIVPRG